MVQARAKLTRIVDATRYAVDVREVAGRVGAKRSRKAALVMADVAADEQVRSIRTAPAERTRCVPQMVVVVRDAFAGGRRDAGEAVAAPLFDAAAPAPRIPRTGRASGKTLGSLIPPSMSASPRGRPPRLVTICTT